MQWNNLRLLIGTCGGLPRTREVFRVLESDGIKTDWWRWILVLVLTPVAGMFIIILFLGGVFYFLGDAVSSEMFDTVGFLPEALVLTSAIIAVYLPVTLLFVRIFHGRAVRPFVTRHPRFRWNRLFAAAGIWLFVLVLWKLGMLALHPGFFYWQLDSALVPWLLVALLITPFGAAAEEVVIRGYLFQGLTRLTRRPWVAMIITAIVSVVLHAPNVDFSEFGREWGSDLADVAVWSLCVGVLVFLEEGLEAAIGAHAVNNMFVAVRLGTRDVSSIFMVDPHVDLSYDLGLIVAAVAGLAIYLWIRRREKAREVKVEL